MAGPSVPELTPAPHWEVEAQRSVSKLRGSALPGEGERPGPRARGRARNRPEDCPAPVSAPQHEEERRLSVSGLKTGIRASPLNPEASVCPSVSSNDSTCPPGPGGGGQGRGACAAGKERTKCFISKGEIYHQVPIVPFACNRNHCGKKKKQERRRQEEGLRTSS